jgi:threonine/homoserine efflux transporter RhtA
MQPTAPPRNTAFDTAIAAVLDNQYAAAERLVNFVRMGVIGALAVIAAVWSSALTYQLNLVNIGVLAPMAIWSVGQQVDGRRRVGR